GAGTWLADPSRNLDPRRRVRRVKVRTGEGGPGTDKVGVSIARHIACGDSEVGERPKEVVNQLVARYDKRVLPALVVENRDKAIAKTVVSGIEDLVIAVPIDVDHGPGENGVEISQCSRCLKIGTWLRSIGQGVCIYTGHVDVKEVEAIERVCANLQRSVAVQICGVHGVGASTAEEIEIEVAIVRSGGAPCQR